MNPFQAALAQAVKPILKEVFDNIVVPELTKLVAQIPNADLASLVAQIQGSIDAEVDKLLT